MSELLCGIDIGGTFTDCVVIDKKGQFTSAKSLSTPADRSVGIYNVLTAAAKKRGEKIEEMVGKIALLSHGTTIGTNALIERTGAIVGLLTTKGHEDAIHIMRGSRGITGRELKKLCHYPSSSKPNPIVPKRLIRGISERVDCFGNEVAPLNEVDVRKAVKELVTAGVEAIAVCYLWSFKAPQHEMRTKAIIKEMMPDMFVTCSAELVPKWGEYERMTAVALNAHTGPIVADYMQRVDERLKNLGYQHPLQITTCSGGTVSVEKSKAAPLLTLDSGPVSGVTGSAYLGKVMGHSNIITTDMGGTSFDVGVIKNGQAAASYISSVNQYEYFLPRVDIDVIGAGGGSIATVDKLTGTLKVGPLSAGSTPGPICYGRGGTQPTVTDANLVLGRLDPNNFAGGSIKLDKKAAEIAITKLGKQIGKSMMETAAGICRIVEFNMADLIRQVTIQKGYDPRHFVLYAFGGAGALHATAFASALDIEKVIVPQRECASVWCAFGASAADILHLYERSQVLVSSTWSAEKFNQIFLELGKRGSTQLSKDGDYEQTLTYSIDIRHRGQINEVEVMLHSDRMNEEGIENLKEAFFTRYEELYGKGAAFRAAELEAVTFRCRASATTMKPLMNKRKLVGEKSELDAFRPSRQVWWTAVQKELETTVMDGMKMLPGNLIKGPALIETPDTTVVVPPSHQIQVDEYGNFELSPI